MTPEYWARFIAKIERRCNSCWEWVGSRDANGYGKVWDGKKRPTGAHRVSYEFFKGPIQSGLVIDHLCRNTSCVNPLHLEAVSYGENIRRGKTTASTTASNIRRKGEKRAPRTAEHRANLSANHTRPNLGKTLSKATKQKMANTRRKWWANKRVVEAIV